MNGRVTLIQTHTAPPSPHVLVVDDESATRWTVGEILEEEGFSVATAGDGEEALARIAEHQPDVILLDLQLPGMDGWQVHAWLKRLALNIPVIFMSAGIRAQVAARTQQAAGFLAKPFDLDDLLAVVQRNSQRPVIA